MNRKKIAFLCSSKAWGGLEMNIVKLANGLKNHNNDVTILAANDTRLYINSVRSNLNTIQINKHKKYFDFINAFKISSILKNIGINYLFVFHSNDTEIASLIKIFNKNLVLIYQQHMHIGRRKKDFLHTLRYSRFQLWITPLEMLVDEIKKLTNFPVKRVKVIPIGVDHKKLINDTRTKHDCRINLGMDLNSFYFGILGRIDKQKGQLDLLKALNIINKEYPYCKVLIMGEKTIGSNDEYYNKIKAFVADNYLEKLVEFVPFSNDIGLFFKSIDCYVMASRSETYGMVTIEAMMSEVPVIGTARGGTIELLKNGEFGKLYARGIIEELADKMKECMENYDQACSTARKAKEFALEKFTLDREIELINYELSNLESNFSK